jgi:DNA-binding IclR family transcriptional regulator
MTAIIDDPATLNGDGSVNHSLSVLGKAQLLFAAFNGARTTLGLTELSRLSGVPKASAYRLAQELVRLNFLERVAGGYQLGWRMFELGQLVPGPARLRRIARPTLNDLHAVTKAVIHLAVPDGEHSFYLERFAGRRQAYVLGSVSDRFPQCFTASGKLFLARSHDSDRIIKMLERGEFKRPTNKSVMSADVLRGQLEAVRERGWSVEREECLEGYKTYAVPIDVDGSLGVSASVSATIDIDRRDDQQVMRALRAASADIGQGLRHSITGVRGVLHSR